ncbi:MAG: leucine-rich repeat domain-containing protein, partial [Bacteroidaceae bacterium]|nr:leucine-rich repeat domain-containing protein [Bacteroidaceae bacterium]
SSLISITLRNSVTTIVSGTFRDCSSLTSVTIPNSVTAIGPLAFYCCSSLTSVTIPNSVTTIDSEAFRNCSSLNSITIPNSATTIGFRAFSSCNSLKDIYCLADSVPNTKSDVFYGVEQSSATLHVPASSIQAYSTTSPWSGFGNIVAIGEGDGIEQLTSETFTNPTAYDLSGRRTANKQKGINLLRNAEGRVKKVLRR